MLSAVLALATLGLAGLAAWASHRAAFALLVGSIMLIPASLSLPTAGVTSLLTVHRVVILGALVGIVWRHRRRDLFRATPTAFAFLLYLAIVLVTGIMLAPTVLNLSDQISTYLGIVEQAVVLVTCTALVRLDEQPAWFIKPLAAVLVISAGIAAIEHVTGNSWSHWLFRFAPSQQGNPAAAELAHRAGTVRVRAGNEYPLGFAWVAAALLPLFFVVAVRLPRWRVTALLLGSGVIVASIYWSFARSAIVGLIVGVVVLGALARDRRVSALVVVAAALTLAAFVAAPELSQHFSSSIDQGSVDVRHQRIPIVLGAVADHPWTGLGLTGLQTVGLQGVDATYLLTYGVTGAVGLAALLGLLAVGFFGVVRGVLAELRESRLAAAAIAAGVVTFVAAGGAFDSMALNGTADVLWVLVAVGTVLAERSIGPVVLRPAPSLLPPVAALAALAGIGLFFAAPTNYSRQVQFSTLPVVQEAATYNPVQPGNTLVNTACGAARAQAAELSGVTLTCRDLFTAPGLGELRVQAGSADAVDKALKRIDDSIRRAGVRSIAPVPETPLTAGLPTAAVTSPAWLPVLAVMLLFAWSGVALRLARRRARGRAGP
jgi:hypothetical protein